MVLGIFVILMVALIAYYHYVQGLLGATISALCAAVAVVTAFAYYEPLTIRLASKSSFMDQAPAMLLCTLFAFTYIVLRIILDKIVPGNIRVPVLVDKIGAAVMGFVAGAFALGTMVIAAQMLPFGPSIAGYSRYTINDTRSAIVPDERQDVDALVREQTEADRLNPDEAQHLLLPVDDWVLNFVAYTSAGSMSSSQKLTDVHPHLLTEYFGQRLGVEQGGRISIMNTDAQQQVSLQTMFTVKELPQVPDIVYDKFDRAGPVRENIKSIQSPLKAPGGQTFLIVRVRFEDKAPDIDNYVRFSPAGVRINTADGDATQNIRPLGTLWDGKVLMNDRVDDFIVVDMTDANGGAVDLVFLVPAGVAAGKTVREGTFLEIKRFGRLDLSDQKVELAITPSLNGSVIFKPSAVKIAQKVLGGMSLDETTKPRSTNAPETPAQPPAQTPQPEKPVEPQPKPEAPAPDPGGF